MADKYVITWETPRGTFRMWDRYSDRSKAVARELFAMGALGVEVYNTVSETVIFERGKKMEAV